MHRTFWGVRAPASLKHEIAGGCVGNRRNFLGRSRPSLIEAQAAYAAANAVSSFLGRSRPSLIEAIMESRVIRTRGALSGAFAPQPH